MEGGGEGERATMDERPAREIRPRPVGHCQPIPRSLPVVGPPDTPGQLAAFTSRPPSRPSFATQRTHDSIPIHPRNHIRLALAPTSRPHSFRKRPNLLATNPRTRRRPWHEPEPRLTGASCPCMRVIADIGAPSSAFGSTASLSYAYDRLRRSDAPGTLTQKVP